jgi:hypothetical protein
MLSTWSAEITAPTSLQRRVPTNTQWDGRPSRCRHRAPRPPGHDGIVPAGVSGRRTSKPGEFGNRDIPFQRLGGWRSTARRRFGSLLTNNPSFPAIRETDYVDGFDVHQCRTPTALEPDTCPNAHGLDQNIYGTAVALPVG